MSRPLKAKFCRMCSLPLKRCKGHVGEPTPNFCEFCRRPLVRSSEPFLVCDQQHGPLIAYTGPVSRSAFEAERRDFEQRMTEAGL